MMGRDERRLVVSPWFVACKDMVALQHAALLCWMQWWDDALRLQERLAADQLDLFTHLQPGRRYHDMPDAGPDLMEHYGHRAHDVDVERI